MSDSYKRLDEELDATQPSAPSAELRGERTLKFLTVFQLASSGIIFLLTIVTFALTMENHMIPPIDATGIWGAVLAMLAASFGFAVFNQKKRGKCPVMTYFVLSILTAIAMGILMILSVMWLGWVFVWKGRLEDYGLELEEWKTARNTTEDTLMSKPTYDGPSESVVEWYESLTVLLSLLGAIHMVCAIVSLALMCCNWQKLSMGSRGDKNVVYVPASNIMVASTSPSFMVAQEQQQYSGVSLETVLKQDDSEACSQGEGAAAPSVISVNSSHGGMSDMP